MSKNNIATETKVVRDPNTGTTRQVIAGQEIPPELVGAEEGGKSIVEEGYDGPGVDELRESAENNHDDELDGKTRDELNDIAEQEGVDDPAGMSNKDEVIAAIRDARA